MQRRRNALVTHDKPLPLVPRKICCEKPMRKCVTADSLAWINAGRQLLWKSDELDLPRFNFSRAAFILDHRTSSYTIWSTVRVDKYFWFLLLYTDTNQLNFSDQVLSIVSPQKYGTSSYRVYCLERFVASLQLVTLETSPFNGSLGNLRLVSPQSWYDPCIQSWCC